MSKELVKTEIGMMTFTEPQIDLIKRQIANGTTADELALFLYVAKKTGLDPLTRQIHCVKRRAKDKKTNQWIDKMTIQTGIDGYRVIAERTGDYAGQDEPEFIYKLNEQGKKTLECAKVKVYKWKGQTRYCAGVGVAYWDEYVVMVDEYNGDSKTGNQVPNSMWEKMPHGQLSKVAEALALRKAFPQDLSGIYTNTEMEQADVRGEDLPTPKIEITKSADEYRKDYIALTEELEELLRQSNDRSANGWAARNHPDNWKEEQTAENFVMAIDVITQKINEKKSKLGK